jgi:hypothetical protein
VNFKYATVHYGALQIDLGPQVSACKKGNKGSRNARSEDTGNGDGLGMVHDGQTERTCDFRALTHAFDLDVPTLLSCFRPPAGFSDHSSTSSSTHGQY